MDPQIDASRAHYTLMRRLTGCPPVICIKSPWGYLVEVKDGSVHIDQLNACNTWDAKTYAVEEWARRNPKKKD